MDVRIEKLVKVSPISSMSKYQQLKVQFQEKLLLPFKKFYKLLGTALINNELGFAEEILCGVHKSYSPFEEKLIKLLSIELLRKQNKIEELSTEIRLLINDPDWGHDYLQAELRVYMGIYYSIRLNNKKAVLYLQQSAIKIRHELNILRLISLAKASYGAEGNLEKSKDYLKEALQLSIESGSNYELPLVLKSFAAVWRNEGKYMKSIGAFSQAGLLCRQYNCEAGEAQCNAGIAGVFEELGDDDSALFYYESAIKVFEEYEDEYNTIRCQLRFAKCLGTLGLLKQAEECVIGVEEKIGHFNSDSSFRVFAELLHGMILSKNKKWKKALSYYNSAFDNSRNIDQAVTKVQISYYFYMLFVRSGGEIKWNECACQVYYNTSVMCRDDLLKNINLISSRSRINLLEYLIEFEVYSNSIEQTGEWHKMLREERLKRFI